LKRAWAWNLLEAEIEREKGVVDATGWDPVKIE
jgi:hypothetical protein